MSVLTIYHNPRCRKSRETLQIIENKGAEYEVVKYLEEPLSESGLKKVLEKLNAKPGDIVRKQEKIFKENYKGKNLSDEVIIKAIAEHPKLMERPIVVKGEKAVIGRPPENVKELL